MSWMSRNTHTLFQPFFAAVLMLTIAGCANTGSYESTGNGRIGPDLQQAVPEYVRNLPKSRTGNMAEYTVFGKRYRVLDSAAQFSEQGTASWYGKKFHGRKTSSGELYDMHAMTAAHKHLPLPTYVRVTNLENNRSVVVKVNDRGPFVGSRIIDLSFAAATQLDMADQGTANVRVDALSTHLVAENDNASNRSVVQTFGENVADSEMATPEVLEPTLAAAPLNRSADVIKQFENEIEPTSELGLTQNADVLNNIDGSDDGFVELIAKADAPVTDAPATDAPVINAPLVEQPIEVQIMDVAEQPVMNKPKAQSEENYFIQLGAFGHAPNADALVADVTEKLGLSAFVEKDEGQDLFRVKLGPYEKGNTLDSAMTELASIGIDGYTKQAVKR